MEGLSPLFEVATDEIYLDCLSIDEDSLSTTFTKGCKVKRLALCYCYLEVSPIFKIDWEIDYSIEELDLYMSCNEFDSK